MSFISAIVRNSIVAITGVGIFQPVLAQPNAAGSFDVTQIVPNGRVGEYTHGSYPSQGERTHAGIDIPAPCQSSVIKAWKSGTVIDTISSKSDRNFSSLGYMVLIDHGVVNEIGKRTFSIYLHMSEPPKTSGGVLIQPQDQVSAGSQIGRVGETGAAFGCHVHFELRHFSSRFSPDWLNIYGKGDKRTSPEFLRDWTDPLKLRSNPQQRVNPVAPQPVAYDRQYSRDNITFALPDRTRLLPEMRCNKKIVGKIGKRVPIGIRCLMLSEHNGITFAAYQNWNRTPENPGSVRILAVHDTVEDLGSISSDNGGVATVWNETNFEVLALSLSGRSGRASDQPYARYRVVGQPGSLRLTLISAGPKVNGVSLVERDRQSLLRGSQPSQTDQSPEVAASGSLTNPPPRTMAGNNSRCPGVRSDGVITNLTDLFLCDKSEAMSMLAGGRRILFTADSIEFNQGVFVAQMKQKSQVGLDADRQQMDDCKRNRRMYCENEYVKAGIFFCKIPSNKIQVGRPVVVFAKLETYNGAFAMFRCE